MKAEERAMKAYPPKYVEQKRHPKKVQSEKVDTHQHIRTIYIEGYHQAEEDLVLTWEDISTLRVILDDVEQEFRKGLHENKDYIGYCKEVLKRFKNLKK